MLFGQHALQIVEQLDSTRVCYLPEHQMRPRDIILGYLQQHIQEESKASYECQVVRQRNTYQKVLSELTEFSDEVLTHKGLYTGNHPNEIGPLIIDRIQGYQPSYFEPAHDESS